MPVSVNQPRQKSAAELEAQDPLSTIMKGLQIAGSIYGIKDASTKSDLLKQQMELEKRKVDQADQTLAANNDGVLSQKDFIAQAHNYKFVPEGTDGAIPFRVKGQDGTVQTYYGGQKPKEVDPIVHSIHEQQLADAKRKSDEAKNGKILPATEALAFGSSNAAFQALGDAGKAFEANKDISGPMKGRWTQLQGAMELGDDGTKAKIFDAQLKANAQIIGKSLEGGKLTDQDIERYKQMLPNLNDSPDAAKGKIAVLQSILAQKQNAESTALGDSGYNTGSIQLSQAPDNPNLTAHAAHGITPEEARQELIRRKGIGSALLPKPGRN